MKKHIILIPFTILILLALFISFVSPYAAYADQYGEEEEQPQDIVIDKEVKDPITGAWVENLLAGDNTYSPTAEVHYQLIIHNSGERDFAEVKVTDTIPSQAKDARVADIHKSKTQEEKFENGVLTFKILDLKVDETETIEVISNLKDASAFDKSQDPQCDITNYAKAEADDEADEDKAKICVQFGEVLGVTTLPSAGPEDYLPLLPFLLIGIYGIKLLLKRSPVSTGI